MMSQTFGPSVISSEDTLFEYQENTHTFANNLMAMFGKNDHYSLSKLKEMGVVLCKCIICFKKVTNI